jgi:hypothetical protein
VPRLALQPRTWRPYLLKKEWAVFALDDLKPWLKSMQHLGVWLSQILVRATRERIKRRGPALGPRIAS